MDALLTALTFTSGRELLDHRRSVIVITSSPDSGSQADILTVKTRAAHLVRERGVELHVFAIGDSEQPFIAIQEIAHASGGHFYLTSLATLPSQLRDALETVR